MPIGPARMPIMDHLGELRRRVTIIVVSVIVCALIVYFATPALIELMMGQIESAMHGQELVVISVLGGFTIRFKVALFFSAIICSPIIIWEILAFFLPALKPRRAQVGRPHGGGDGVPLLPGYALLLLRGAVRRLWVAPRPVL